DRRTSRAAPRSQESIRPPELPHWLRSQESCQDFLLRMPVLRNMAGYPSGGPNAPISSLFLTEEPEFGRRMPQEAHLRASGPAADVCLNPCLVRAELDPDPACLVAGFVAGCPAVGKAPPVTTDKRVDIVDSAADRLEVAWPTASSRQDSRRPAGL